MNDIDHWMTQAVAALRRTFGDRLLCVGLQGSRLRGEARPDSDIDILVVVDGLRFDDLDRFHAAMAGLPDGERAVGFTCGRRELAAWPRYELFQFLRGTRCWFGDLKALLPALDESDIRYGARVEVADLYHMTAHAYLTAGGAIGSTVGDVTDGVTGEDYAMPAGGHDDGTPAALGSGDDHDGHGGSDGQTADGMLAALCKAYFFALQMVLYLRTGEFPDTKRAALGLLRGAHADGRNAATPEPPARAERRGAQEGGPDAGAMTDEEALLRCSMDPALLDACDAAERRRIYRRLFDWCGRQLRAFDALH
ncbi:nucleotidyltransferase domain-containing protein [Bifidobacterium phasiani]|uniref:Nucleotidyltransferase domain-containing protein n=1 Tax=Bifidobacterium phasiani TaxID=2834431 RepID=A0ABS6W621_9BIFI|nr:nucleotidyltransferase domain-containing protein [Bifidobacterium phasiani]MBW3081939.1 nucleotidyltransferase domain-containing protein [Bifidobacterium phasiani]